MKYSNVYIDAIGYELAPVVVTTAELEERVRPLYEELHIPVGQLETITGIHERRWWEPGYSLSKGATLAADKALSESSVRPNDVDVLIYAGVCRENFEPATACRVAAGLGVNSTAALYDLSNACLGVLNGIINVANMIELGQIRAGLVVSCETAREINEAMIEQMLKEQSMDIFKTALATLTGGSGAVAVLLTDRQMSGLDRHKLVGGVTRTEPQHHALCRWGMEPSTGSSYQQTMMTESVDVLKYGVELGQKTWKTFLAELDWSPADVDRVICHQVGSSHQTEILKNLRIPAEKDFTTFEYLGNIGTVSLPLTAALAEEREAIRAGQKVAFLGIGSGLNCLMLGLEW
jgi:3-oxoacyl-[acyl-carrier-protein] synthase-3